MTVYYNYEADKKLYIPYRKISEDVILAVCDYEACPYEAEVSLTFLDNEAIRVYNRYYRGIDKPTDVLSFPLNESGELTEFNPESGELMLGDIVISVDKVISQAEEYGHTRKRELAFLVCHSMLHLFGYDHIDEDERKDMENIQERILNSRGYYR